MALGDGPRESRALGAATPSTVKKAPRRPSSARARAMKALPGEPGPGEFVPMEKWDGPRPGMIYKCGNWGPGYYQTAKEQRSNRSNTTDSGGTPKEHTGSSDLPPAVLVDIINIYQNLINILSKF